MFFKKKHPQKQSEKKKFRLKYKWFKMSYLEFFSWKYYFGIQRFYVCPDVPVDIIRVFFLISDFLAKVSKPTKASKKDHTFYNTVPLKKTSLILRTSNHFTLKTISARSTAKKLSDFKNFQQTCFCLMSQKIFALHHFLKPKNYILEALWKQMSVYFYIPFKKFCFQKRSNVLAGGGGMGGR